jgi:hypothetical protein
LLLTSLGSRLLAGVERKLDPVFFSVLLEGIRVLLWKGVVWSALGLGWRRHDEWETGWRLLLVYLVVEHWVLSYDVLLILAHPVSESIGLLTLDVQLAVVLADRADIVHLNLLLM